MKVKAVLLRNLKRGDFFVLRDSSNIYIDKRNSSPVREELVYIRGHYDRATKTYCCYKFNDINRESFFKGNRIVYNDFIF